jgi:hypothetical protein
MKAKPSSHPADPAVKERERGAATREVAQRAPRERRRSTAQPHGPPDDYEAFADKLVPALADAVADGADAHSLTDFCRRHSISLQMYYKLASQDRAPQTFSIGTRVLVSRESAARWRREREEASAADKAVND